MFRPDVGGDRIRHFVAVFLGVDAGTSVYAEVRMDIDDSGRDPATCGIDHERARRCCQSLPNRLDAAVLDEYIGLIETRAASREYGRSANQSRRTREYLVRRREGCSRWGPRMSRDFRRMRRRGLGFLRLSGATREGNGKDCEQ